MTLTKIQRENVTSDFMANTNMSFKTVKTVQLPIFQHGYESVLSLFRVNNFFHFSAWTIFDHDKKQE